MPGDYVNGSILIGTVHYPVKVLGFGRRLGIWVQGCRIGCKGCVSKHSWDFDERKRVSIAGLIRWARETCQSDVDGVTISGGEPFDHADDLGMLVGAVRQWFDSLPPREDGWGRDILCYSGYAWSRLRRKHLELVSAMDAVVSGPYVDGRPLAYLRGSDNQVIHCLSDLGRLRYGGSQSLAPVRAMQLIVDERQRVWMIGIPDKGVMNGVRDDMRADGFEMRGVSWV